MTKDKETVLALRKELDKSRRFEEKWRRKYKEMQEIAHEAQVECKDWKKSYEEAHEKLIETLREKERSVKEGSYNAQVSVIDENKTLKREMNILEKKRQEALSTIDSFEQRLQHLRFINNSQAAKIARQEMQLENARAFAEAVFRPLRIDVPATQDDPHAPRRGDDDGLRFGESPNEDPRVPDR